MNRLILFSILSMLCTGVFAQEASISSSESFQKFRTKTQNGIFSLIENTPDSSLNRMGDLCIDSFKKNAVKSQSNIKLIVAQMQHLLDTETGQDFKTIQYHGAQKSTCDGVETVELIKNNSFKIENFVSVYLKKYFR
ncbi:hypothetical protein [Flammeovirga aprica]|uniref:Uncharacterized protein n=1 Tax=Flammeovirga aprica JL-4 TaxID=694437 RepID=A0A7X9XD04_9BACT|nr:hypothetical protein [Flammeovirga aprica]NME72283.1 hypothetical protein [Flammeovirga aprica JL-4]